jgi:hypothetical protein
MEDLLIKKQKILKNKGFYMRRLSICVSMIIFAMYIPYIAPCLGQVNSGTIDTDRLEEVFKRQVFWPTVIDALYPGEDLCNEVAFKLLLPMSDDYLLDDIKGFTVGESFNLDSRRGTKVPIYSSKYVNGLYAIIWGTTPISSMVMNKSMVSMHPYINHFQDIFNIMYGEAPSIAFTQNCLNSIEKPMSDVYELTFKIPIRIKEVKSDDNIINALKAKYNKNIDFLNNKDDVGKLDEPIVISRINRTNLIDIPDDIKIDKKILSILVRLLKESGIKNRNIKMIKIYDEKNTDTMNPQAGFNRIPLSIELVASYNDIQNIAKAVNDSEYLMYIGLIGIYNESASRAHSHVMFSLNRGELFSGAKCEIVIEFITSMGIPGASPTLSTDPGGENHANGE